MPAPLPKPVSDIHTVGNPDTLQLLFKASNESEGWIKSTKAMLIESGCLVQTATQQRNPDGSYAVAEAICFIPNVRVEPDVNGGKKLVAAK